MNSLLALWHATIQRLEGLGQWLAPLALRLLLFWEFWEAGREKFSGSNWFMDIQGNFPFPFDRVPSDLSWAMATWFELIGALALLLGLATRLFAFGLSVLTIVAIAAVHWQGDFSNVGELIQGYAITDRGHGNYKLPLIFLILLLPLLLRGAGRLSLDALIARRWPPSPALPPKADAWAWGGLAVAMGVPAAMLLPVAGFAATGVGMLLLGWAWRQQRQR